MHNKSKSHHPYTESKIEGSSKYSNFIDYRIKNSFLINVENQEESGLSLSQVRTPYVPINRVIATQRKDISLIGISSKKSEIKEKIKDRIKAEIQNLIKRNTFTIKKVQNCKHTKESQPSESVGIVGFSFIRSFGQKQNKKLKNIRKSIILSELAFNSRKAKSSLDHRPITGQDLSKNEGREKVCTPITYRRSMSTDIRVKNMVKRKASESEFMRKMDKNKDDALQPWVISSFVEEDQHF